MRTVTRVSQSNSPRRTWNSRLPKVGATEVEPVAAENAGGDGYGIM